MRMYMPGDTTQDPNAGANIAAVRAQAQQATAQTQQDTAEDMAARKTGQISGTGTLTQYRPNGGGRAAGHLQDAVNRGTGLGDASSYDHGEGAPQPVQIIRGTTSTYQIPGKDTGAPDREGTGPVDSATAYGDGSTQSLPVFASGYNPQPGTGQEFATPQQAQQEYNRGNNIGEYAPPGAEALALKHQNTIEEIEKRAKMSGGDQKDAAQMDAANVKTFDGSVSAEPHFQVDVNGKKVLHPYVDKMREYYSGLVASRKMAPDEAIRQLNDHVMPQLYNEKVGTPQLAANQVTPFVNNFKHLYGVDLPPAAVKAYLQAGDPTKKDGTVDTDKLRERQTLILKTLAGSQDIPMARNQQLLSSPAVAAGKVTAAPGVTPVALGTPAAPTPAPALAQYAPPAPYANAETQGENVTAPGGTNLREMVGPAWGKPLGGATLPQKY